jgi:methylated-DNA-[protein]-cysteine S-methyltransferase
MTKKSRPLLLAIDTFQSPLGELYLIFAGDALAEMRFNRPQGIDPVPPICPEYISHSLKTELEEYFKGILREFRQEVVLLRGTDFEKKVWLALRDIPYGETRPYKWLAEKVGNPKAIRAAGRALGRNPLPIIMPCHRIIESDGSIGGYSGGIDIKRRLLDLEYYHTIGIK